MPIRLVVPDGTALVVREVSCDVIDVPDITSVTSDAASVRAWASRLTGATPLPLPVAAHAEADPTGTAVTTAAYARWCFDHTSATAVRLKALLTATLRPYQMRGVAWLEATLPVTGGAVLADEMGLGKTVQAIGAMALRAEQGAQLVICPTSLISNWVREITRFSPGLEVTSDLPADELPAPGTVVVASYTRLRLSADRFTGHRWATVIFDEAQGLKNPRTQVAHTARALDADGMVALTGTPIENSLDDLWAILRVVTPTVFPHKAVFRRRFTRAVDAGDVAALGRMRAAVAPVMLARRKSVVATSLPPKIANPVLCDLTDEQADLYDAYLESVADDGFGEGIERHGRVVATLTRLKQICNHPRLVTGDTGPIEGRSGKLNVCEEILVENVAARAPTLVFTQYRATAELLVRRFSELLGLDIPFFHGGLSTAERSTLVDDFQDGRTPDVMVMTLKSGGVGLTLTRACDVVHFDRWWNPAVEAQASDRVHRIGQERPVTVTTLTTATTLEEHIDTMHLRKSALGTHTDDSSILTTLAALDDERLLDVLRRRRSRP